MKEFITIGDKSFVTNKTQTTIDTISFTLECTTVEVVEAVFKKAQSLTVGTDKEVYGEYPDVEFQSMTIGAEGEITVTMHILSKSEKQIRDLQTSQAEQDEAIAQMLYGGGEEDE